jgi:type IV pilus assembly protein PilA
MTNQPHYPQGPYYQQQPPPPKKGMHGCIIALIVMAVLAVPGLGIFVALGVYGTRRYVASAKTAEAKNAIGAISRAAVAAYERETLAEGQAQHQLCKSATPVPATVPMGVKYQPSVSDFNTGSTDAGWRCLRFAMSTPMYYQYHYRQGKGMAAPEQPSADGFEAMAMGDLNGNGVTSRFSRTGRVTGGRLVVDTTIAIDKEFE